MDSTYGPAAAACGFRAVSDTQVAEMLQDAAAQEQPSEAFDVIRFKEHLKETARRIAPDYPGIGGPLSSWELLWAITSSFEGTEEANKACHAYISQLRAALRKLLFQASHAVGEAALAEAKRVVDAFYRQPATPAVLFDDPADLELLHKALYEYCAVREPVESYVAKRYAGEGYGPDFRARKLDEVRANLARAQALRVKLAQQ